MPTRYVVTFSNGRRTEVHASLRAARQAGGRYTVPFGDPGTWGCYPDARRARADAESGTAADAVITQVDTLFALQGDCPDAEWSPQVQELIRQSIE